MKKTLYILSALLLGLVSCNKAEFEGIESRKAEETGLVEVTMKLEVPVELTAATRANYRDSKPHIDHIRVAVFGTSGYPQAYALAEAVSGENQPVAKYADVNNSVFYFKVLLPVYEGEAHVHVIANGDENIQFVDMTEDKIMTTMKTTGNVGAYWARVVMPNGILTIKDENGIMQTNEAGNFIPSAETAHLFEDLVLVRNFAQVTLYNEASNFTVEKWTLVNTPEYGSVAPVSGWEDKYDEDGEPVDEDEDGVTDKEAVYVEDYQDYVFNNKDGGKMVLAELDEDGNVVQSSITATYNGYMIPGSDNIVTAIPEESTWTSGDSCFVYERIDPNKKKPTCVLVKGAYTDDNNKTTTCYYRIDLMDEDLGGYFPLYRNYNYKITIGEVGNKGAADAETAMLRDSGGNVSMTAEAATLTDVSDGKSRLYVEYVDKTFVTGKTSTVKKTFWVYYIPDLTDKYQNDVVVDGVTKHKAGEAKVDNTKITEVKIKEAGDAIVTDSSLTKVEAQSTDDGVYVYEFTLNKQSADKDLESVFHVEAKNGLTGKKKSMLVRDITVRVMKLIDMSLKFEPNPADGEADARTVLHIQLADTLQQSMFPLEFHIEDVNHTLNPTGKDDSSLGTAAKNIEVPVKTAKSIADGTTNSFYFIRTVNWSEYKTMRDQWKAASEADPAQPTDGIIDFRTEFKTLVENSKTTVYVENEYFTTKSIELLKPTSHTETGTATFTYSDFTAGTNVSSTKSNIQITFSRINNVSTYYRELEFTNNPSITMTVSPSSSTTLHGLKIKKITVNYYSSSYAPSTVSSTPTGFALSESTGTWTGSTDGNVVVSMSKNSEFDITGITVEYSHTVED